MEFDNFSPPDQQINTQYIAEEIQKKLTEPMTKAQLLSKMKIASLQETNALSNQLQKLKKEGKIVLIGDTWALNTCSLCTACQGKGWIKNDA